MQINYLAALVCAVLSLVIGSIWYGPLFGKKWMQIVGADKLDEAERKKMQKAAMPLYLLQFALSLFQVYVLAYYIAGWKEASGLTNALWIWAAFVMPIVAGGAMWNNDSKKNRLGAVFSPIRLSAGYFCSFWLSFRNVEVIN